VRPMPIRYVRDMDAARRFYQALGLTVEFTSRAPRRGPSKWVELRGEPGGLALHHLSDEQAPPAVGLSFEAQEPLEDVVARLTAAGYEPHTAIVDEAYGRSFTVRDPEGLLIQVNEHDRELHG
jgi:catechol 2,3-dioxygenase-like lactoylglutathione lyase family enzyme